MARHTQTICRQIANELFESVSAFCKIGIKSVRMRFGDALAVCDYFD